jgi:hypothetical protein
LSSLLKGQAKAISNLETVSGAADKIKADTHDMQRYALTATLGQAIIGFGESTARMSLAIINDRPGEGAGEAMKMIGSVAKLAFLGEKLVGGVLGAWAGPIGMLIGDLLIAAGSGLIEGLAAPQKSLADQIKEQLTEFGGTEKLYQLEGVLDAIERMHADLSSRPENSLSWDDVNRIGRFTGPDEVIWLGTAEAWLGEETRAEVWAAVFESYALVSGWFLQNTILGLKALRTNADGKPTQDLVEAMAVLETICTQYEDMIHKFKPLAAKLATRWFIGSNGNIYRADNAHDERVGRRDTQATSISLGSEGSRLWHLGGNRNIYTVREGGWSGLDEELADDIVVVRQAGTGQDHFLTLKDGVLTYRLWNEDQEGWPKFVKDAPSPLGASAPDRGIKKIAATNSGVVYYLWTASATLASGGHTVYQYALGIWDADGARPLDLPDATGIYGLTTNGENLYVFSHKRIYWRSCQRLTDASASWIELGSPDAKQLGLPSDWTYKDVFAGADGALMAILGDRMYAWCEGKWYQTDGNTAQRVVTHPVGGWEMFSGLESLVTSIGDARNRLRESSEEGDAIPA